MVEAAARNEYNGKELMKLLLQERGQEISITEAVVKAAASNGGNGKEIMRLLLQERDQEISITEAVALGSPNLEAQQAFTCYPI